MREETHPAPNDCHHMFSISSSESMLDGHDTVDAVPKRMPLVCNGEDYVKRSQASLGSVSSTTDRRTWSNSLPKSTRIPESEFAQDSVQADWEIKLNRAVINGDEARSKTLPTDFRNGNTGSKFQEDYGDEDYVETDLGIKRPTKPSLKDTLQQEGDPCLNNDETSCNRTSSQDSSSEEDSSSHGCCSSTGCMMFCAMGKRKYMFSRFSIFDLVMSTLSIGIYIFDVITDVFLVIWYFHYRNQDEDYMLFCYLTSAFVVLPSLIVQIFSLKWFYDDFKKSAKGNYNVSENQERNDNQGCCSITFPQLLKTFALGIIHLFQLATLFRYLRALFYGFKSRYYDVKKREGHRKHFDSLWKYEVHDVNVLRLLESFLESAPQLVLQVYIMLTKSVEIVTVLSCIASLFGLSTAMVSIQRAIRNSNPDKNQLSITASIVMFFWRACTISARVLSFSLFLTVHKLWFLIIFLCHWLVSAIWIGWRGTNFCGGKKVAEYCFDAIVGMVYTFSFFNVHEEKDGETSRSRWRMTIFYVVVFVENSALSLIWFYFQDHPVPSSLNITLFNESSHVVNHTVPSTSNYLYISTPLYNEYTPVVSPHSQFIPRQMRVFLVALVHAFYVLGMTFMIIYYAVLHPQKDTISCQKRKESDSNNADIEQPANVESLPSQSGTPEPANSHREPGNGERAQNIIATSPSNHNEASDTRNQGVTPTTHRKNLMYVFNRGKRAEKVNTRQYSKEKHLDYHGKGHLKTTVTPLTPGGSKEKTTLQEVEEQKAHKRTKQCDDLRKCTASVQQNISANLTGQSFQSNSITQSNNQCPMQSRAGTCVKESSAMTSNQDANLPVNPNPRGYSASMSSLVEGTVSRSVEQKQHSNRPSFSLQADEVLEYIETNV